MPEASPKQEIKKSDKPVKPIDKKENSEFSITKHLDEKQEEPNLFSQIEEDLPDHHFSETDIQKEWKEFLSKLSENNIVAYNAVNSFQLHKIGENQIEVVYSSNSAKQEFEKIQADFFNHFKKKVNNFKIEISYRNDVGIKREILTKRKIFDKFAEINPTLLELENLMKFDFS